MPRVLAVFAHPDDLEFLAAGTLRLWTRQGWQAALVLLTSGGGGTSDASLDPSGLEARREQEAGAAARALGIAEIRFLRRTDGALVHDLALRRDIAREIRRFRPDVVLAQDPALAYHGRHYINHPDHRAAGEAVLAAVYPTAKKPLLFPELLREGFPPHLVSQVWLAGSPDPDAWVDIEEVLDEKLAAVRLHASQFPDERVEGFVRGFAREAARGTPMRHAESFRTVELRPRSYDPDGTTVDAPAPGTISGTEDGRRWQS